MSQPLGQRPSSQATRGNGNPARSMPAPAFARHSAFGDDEGGDEDDHQRTSRSRREREELVSFDRNGAVKRNRSPPRQGPRVIPMTANLDWRQDRKKRLGLEEKARSMGSLNSMKAFGRPSTSGTANQPSAGDGPTAAVPERINDQEQKKGLQIRQRPEQPDDAMDEDARGAADRDATPPADLGGSLTPPPETAEQAAIRALLAGQGVGSSSAPNAELVISQPDEKDLLQSDVNTRPEAPTLDDYAATPIDQFGAALLRGMGWKEGMGAGRNGKGPKTAPEPKKRAALLGLGAKERPVDPSLPSSGARSSRPPRPDRRYVPVVRDAAPTSSREASSDPSVSCSTS
ncbi:uncharacterized protein PSFLO_03807 [Pseudozyma flocculosa]|uniref:G-patch domain-containing protein n=1 Tax=Pseudozyma flocculosa TaxID=84751 RepID=A0A5C3F2L4_9BASI|nr:uncharacterized protein PSFLO_03807 [Pseudozyma flocculosa]